MKLTDDSFRLIYLPWQHFFATVFLFKFRSTIAFQNCIKIAWNSTLLKKRKEKKNEKRTTEIVDIYVIEITCLKVL